VLHTFRDASVTYVQRYVSVTVRMRDTSVTQDSRREAGTTARDSTDLEWLRAFVATPRVLQAARPVCGAGAVINESCNESLLRSWWQLAVELCGWWPWHAARRMHIPWRQRLDCTGIAVWNCGCEEVIDDHILCMWNEAGLEPGEAEAAACYNESISSSHEFFIHALLTGLPWTALLSSAVVHKHV